MKLNKNFLVHKSKNEVVIVPSSNAGFSGIIKGNAVLGEIAELLKNDTTAEKIVKTLSDKYFAPDGVIEKDVAAAIEKLKNIDAIDE